MILLDTNVVSAMMRPTPDVEVRAWLNDQETKTLYLSSVTIAELLFGIGVMPVGKKRTALSLTLTGLMELFENRVLPFDAKSARTYADLAVRARAAGKGFPVPDGYIAAIAVSQGLVVASRDVAPFEAAGIKVINPWRR